MNSFTFSPFIRYSLGNLALIAVSAVTHAAPTVPPGAIKLPDCKAEAASFCKKKDLVTGYDFCDTDYLEGYQDLSACQKQVYLDWNVTHNGAYTTTLPPVGGAGVFDLPNLRDTVYLAITFDTSSDFMPGGRKKLLHTTGSTAKIRFVAEKNTPYTGIFRGGIGLARLSVATSDVKNKFAPGLALKFLIAGEQSVNIMAMFSLDGQGKNRDFFANRFSTWIEDPKDPILGTLLLPKFAQVLAPPTRLPLEHFAQTDTLGRKEAKPNAPHSFYLVPESGLSAANAATSQEDFRRVLGRLKAGTKLYSVFAIDEKPGNPNAAKADGGVLIGSLVLESTLKASKWEDERLFFQHARP
ncbi:MAG: hypothetical protein AAB425_14665 [Bdellovibrionota bacterium]